MPAKWQNHFPNRLSFKKWVFLSKQILRLNCPNARNFPTFFTFPRLHQPARNMHRLRDKWKWQPDWWKGRRKRRRDKYVSNKVNNGILYLFLHFNWRVSIEKEFFDFFEWLWLVRSSVSELCKLDFVLIVFGYEASKSQNQGHFLNFKTSLYRLDCL